MSMGSGLAGLWAGEMVFLVVVAAYVAGLLAVTTQRPPVSRAALAIGTGVGIAVGLAMYALPPLAHPPHVANAWLTGAYTAARVLVLPLVAGAGVAAGLMAARRTSGRGSQLPLADTRARQGVAAGLCAGAAAALLLSVLGISTIALLPQEAARLQWALPGRHTAPGSVYAFEVSLSNSAAGHLLVLILAPLLFAGLGAWGGLYGAGRPGRRPGGGGGGAAMGPCRSLRLQAEPGAAAMLPCRPSTPASPCRVSRSATACRSQQRMTGRRRAGARGCPSEQPPDKPAAVPVQRHCRGRHGERMPAAKPFR